MNPIKLAFNLIMINMCGQLNITIINGKNELTVNYTDSGSELINKTINGLITLNDLMTMDFDGESNLIFFCGINEAYNKYDSFLTFFIGNETLNVYLLNNSINGSSNLLKTFNSLDNFDIKFIYDYSLKYCMNDYKINNLSFIPPKMFVERHDDLYICYAANFTPSVIVMSWLCENQSLEGKPFVFYSNISFNYSVNIMTSNEDCVCVISHNSMYTSAIISFVDKQLKHVPVKTSTSNFSYYLIVAFVLIMLFVVAVLYLFKKHYKEFKKKHGSDPMLINVVYINDVEGINNFVDVSLM